jgi:hypothetical protein
MLPHIGGGTPGSTPPAEPGIMKGGVEYRSGLGINKVLKNDAGKGFEIE